MYFLVQKKKKKQNENKNITFFIPSLYNMLRIKYIKFKQMRTGWFFMRQ